MTSAKIKTSLAGRRVSVDRIAAAALVFKVEGVVARGKRVAHNPGKFVLQEFGFFFRVEAGAAHAQQHLVFGVEQFLYLNKPVVGVAVGVARRDFGAGDNIVRRLEGKIDFQHAIGRAVSGGVGAKQKRVIVGGQVEQRGRGLPGRAAVERVLGLPAGERHVFAPRKRRLNKHILAVVRELLQRCVLQPRASNPDFFADDLGVGGDHAQAVGGAQIDRPGQREDKAVVLVLAGLVFNAAERGGRAEIARRVGKLQQKIVVAREQAAGNVGPELHDDAFFAADEAAVVFKRLHFNTLRARRADRQQQRYKDKRQRFRNRHKGCLFIAGARRARAFFVYLTRYCAPEPKARRGVFRKNSAFPERRRICRANWQN